MPESQNVRLLDPPQVLAFVCKKDSQIESIAIGPGVSVTLKAGQLLLDEVTAINASLREDWKNMVGDGINIQGEVEVPQVNTADPVRMLFHGMALHEGLDEGLFLVTLCTGFRPVTAGPDELARSRAVLNNAVDSIVTIDAMGIVSSVNPATIRLFGYSEAELLGHNVSVLMPSRYRAEHDSYLRNYLRTGNSTVIGVGRRITGRKKDGQDFPAHLAVSEFTVRGVHYFTGIIRDLSELERVQNQLLQSERLAAIGQMVTGLAHESRNALQRAQACLDMLSLDLKDNPEQLDLARRTTTALQDLYRLYEEVRGYAAPIHLDYRMCDLATVWRKEWDNLATIRNNKQIEFIEAEGNQSIRCDIDVHRIEQVFRNIFENAIHACGNRGTIRVQCASMDWQGCEVAKVGIIDNGFGMTPEIAAQVFEPFFTTKQRGTGLGMAIAQRIMIAHSGAISVKALESGGTEIALLIPVNAVGRTGYAFRSG